MEMMDMYEAIEKVEKLLADHNIPCELGWLKNLPVFTVRIMWGDWKHSHAFAKQLIKNAKLGIFMKTNVLETNGSDCYSATHYFAIPEYVKE